MRKLRVKFINLVGTMRVETSLLYEALCELRCIELVDENPEIVFYGDNYAEDHTKYDCVKVYVPIENKMPNFRYCDYAISYLDLPDPRNLRLPFYIQNIESHHFDKSEGFVLRNFEKKKKFCAFVVSNMNIKRSPERVEFFKKLSEYKKVDSGGKVLNNLGYTIGNKLEFLKDYKFTIAFENRSWPGYTSEKIVDPMLAGSVPIYWGNPDIGRDFNTASFINLNDCKSIDEAVERVVRLDQDDEAYMEMMKQPYLSKEGRVLFDKERLKNFLSMVIDSKARRTSMFYFKDISFNLRKNLETRLPALKKQLLR